MNEKQYLIKVLRLSSEAVLTGTDQGSDYAWYILPESDDAPDMSSFVSPQRAGLKRYLGNLSEWSDDCGITPPVSDSDAPAFVDGWQPAGFVAGEYYEQILRRNDTSIALPAAGTTITDFSAKSTSGLSMTYFSGAPESYFALAGRIAANTTSITIPLTVLASNGKSTTKNFTLLPKTVAAPHMGVYYAGSTDKILSVFAAPQGVSAAPYLTIISAPAGFLNPDRMRVQMAVFGGKPMPSLDGLEVRYRTTFGTPPDGVYWGKLELNGKTVYGTWNIKDGTVLDQKIDLSEVVPSLPTGTVDAPTIAAFADQTVRGGDRLLIAIPTSQITFGAGQSLREIAVTSPAGVDASIVTITGSDYAIFWQVPNTYPAGQIDLTLRVMQSDGQLATRVIHVKVISAPYYVRIAEDDATHTLIQLGPVFTDGTISIEGPADFSSVVDKPFTEFDAGTIEGKAYRARYRDRKLSLPGQYIFTFKQSGVTLYASLVLYGSFTGSYLLSLTADKPVRTATPTYQLELGATTLNEGSSTYGQLYQLVNGTKTAVSGAKYYANNAGTGTTVDGNTCAIFVATNANVNDSYTLSVRAELNGVVVGTATLGIADKTPNSSTSLSVLALDYAFTRNNPPSVQTLGQIWVKASGATALEWAYESPGPAGYEFAKSAYAAITAGDYGNGYNNRATFGGVTPGSILKIYIRAVGSATDLLALTLPQLPTTGDVSRTTVYPSATTPVGSYANQFGSGAPEYYTTDN